MSDQRPTVASLVAEGRLTEPDRPELSWHYSRAVGWTWDGDPTVTVVHDPPPLLVGLIRQELGDIDIYICQGCSGTGTAYLTRFSPRESTCRECDGAGRIDIPAADIDDAPDYDQPDLSGQVEQR